MTLTEPETQGKPSPFAAIVGASSLGRRLRRIERLLGSDRHQLATIVWEIPEGAVSENTLGDRLNRYYAVMFIGGTREEQLDELERLRRDPRYQQPTVDQARERPPAACATSDAVLANSHQLADS